VTAARFVLGVSIFVTGGIACGEPERNDPAPPGMSAGSVTIGGGGVSTATTAAATDDPSGGTSGGTVSTSMPTTTASTDDTLTGDTTGIDPSADTGIPDPPTTGVTTFGTDGTFGCEAVGESCEGDGICLQEVSSGGVQIVCSHGNSGEPCSVDADCVSQMCVSEVTSRGVSSICT